MCNENRLPLIGEKARGSWPETTQGTINFPQDYQGKWVILFSHPADFMPVCKTEFMTFPCMIPVPYRGQAVLMCSSTMPRPATSPSWRKPTSSV